jgi:alanyl-tRNA synthetase
MRLLSVVPQELPVAIERLQAELKDQKRAVTALQEDLSAYRAAEIAASAETVRLKPPFGPADGEARLVCRAVDADANALKSLVRAITAQPGFVAVLTSSSHPGLVAIARSADVKMASHELLAYLTKQFGGRGGGKPEIAQAGGLRAAPGDILAAGRAAVSSSIQS